MPWITGEKKDDSLTPRYYFWKEKLAWVLSEYVRKKIPFPLLCKYTIHKKKPSNILTPPYYFPERKT